MANKLKPCARCGTLFLPNKNTQNFCSKNCRENAYYHEKIAKDKAVPVELGCPHNEHLVCEVHNCSQCGWNPEVAQARLEKIVAKMKEDANGQA